MTEPRNRRARKSADAVPAGEETAMTTSELSEETATDVVTETEIEETEVPETEVSEGRPLTDAEQVAKLEEIISTATHPSIPPLASQLYSYRDTVIKQNQRAQFIIDARKKTDESELEIVMRENAWNDAALANVLVELAGLQDTIEAAQAKLSEVKAYGLEITRGHLPIPTDEEIEAKRADFNAHKEEVKSVFTSVALLDSIIAKIPDVEGVNLSSLLPTELSLHGARAKSTSGSGAGTGTQHVYLDYAYILKNESGTDKDAIYRTSRSTGEQSVSTGIVAQKLSSQTGNNTPISTGEVVAAFMAHGNWNETKDIPKGEHRWTFTKQIGAEPDGTPVSRSWDLLFVVGEKKSSR